MPKHKVIIAGGYPPPFGGITVHIQRLANILNRHYKVTVVDFYGKSSATETPQHAIELYRFKSSSLRAMIRVLRKLFFGYGIVHLHVSSGSNVLRILPFVATKISKKLLLTIHGGSFTARLSEKSPLSRTLLRWTLHFFDRIILVNPEQQKAIEGLRIPSSKIAVIPAYIRVEGGASRSLAEKLAEIRSGNEVVLISSGFGLPHYGYHEIIQALARTYQDKKIALILALYNSFDSQYLNELNDLAATMEHLEYVVLQDTHPDEFNYMLGQCDTYIRATTMDGDSVAVREALQHGLKVICSDCVARPSGTALFRCKSVESLSEQLRVANDSLGQKVQPQHDNAKELMDIYQTVCHSKP
ncbi:MAG: glycosyltransferase family 4 protein [Nitrospira sp.]|nr:glycosyltransferase family 4 protein [Nitrospira sp.]